jgi:hypothetical protein
MGISRPGFDKCCNGLSNIPAELASVVRDPSKSDTHGVLPGSEWLDLEFTESQLIKELKKGGNGSDTAHAFDVDRVIVRILIPWKLETSF